MEYLLTYYYKVEKIMNFGKNNFRHFRYGHIFATNRHKIFIASDDPGAYDGGETRRL